MAFGKLFFAFSSITVILLSLSQTTLGKDVVVELTDANFEHDTQATSGATTGPWFIKFYASWCGHCRAMAPAWEKLAEELKGKINVAKIEATNNSLTARRFKIRGFPTLIFINKGKMYSYEGDRTTEKMKAFAQGGYQQTKAQEIPLPMSTFDVLKDEVYNAFLQLHGIVQHAPLPFTILFAIGMMSGFFIAFLVYCCCGRSSDTSDTASKRQKMKKKD